MAAAGAPRVLGRRRLRGQVVGQDAAPGLEAILAAQPFRERPGADAELSAAEHGTEEADFGHEVAGGMAAGLAQDGDVALGRPEQAPLGRKILHLNDLGRAEVVTALAHTVAGVLADGLARIPEEIRAGDLAFDQNRARFRGPADDVGIFGGGGGGFVEHDRALAAEPADAQGD